ncbi:MAG: hypothetical protein P857_863 [Candidatus Xenolissoclinum pacificiensis L6]|uniref:Uncharacterized protein n=1 Tax=Candidatus Xenolissoclinum pacificiensis L6 TaxID=1401685 RepID=W2V231_9RICK|nr:MAG: hypothetical protein P857_863 [Candidatus Xenolissoclinum pacificiensis L6]
MSKDTLPKGFTLMVTSIPLDYDLIHKRLQEGQGTTILNDEQRELIKNSGGIYIYTYNIISRKVADVCPSMECRNPLLAERYVTQEDQQEYREFYHKLLDEIKKVSPSVKIYTDAENYEYISRFRYILADISDGYGLEAVQKRRSIFGPTTDLNLCAYSDIQDAKFISLYENILNKKETVSTLGEEIKKKYFDAFKKYSENVGKVGLRIFAGLYQQGVQEELLNNYQEKLKKVCSEKLAEFHHNSPEEILKEYTHENINLEKLFLLEREFEGFYSAKLQELWILVDQAHELEMVPLRAQGKCSEYIENGIKALYKEVKENASDQLQISVELETYKKNAFSSSMEDANNQYAIDKETRRNQAFKKYRQAVGNLIGKYRKESIDVMYSPCIDTAPLKKDGTVDEEIYESFSYQMYRIVFDHDMATEALKIYIEESCAQGVTPVLKHFLGVGHAKQDTHHDSTVSQMTCKEFFNELRLYRTGIEHYNEQYKKNPIKCPKLMILAGHLRVKIKDFEENHNLYNEGWERNILELIQRYRDSSYVLPKDAIFSYSKFTRKCIDLMCKDLNCNRENVDLITDDLIMQGLLNELSDTRSYKEFRSDVEKIIDNNDLITNVGYSSPSGVPMEKLYVTVERLSDDKLEELISGIIPLDLTVKGSIPDKITKALYEMESLEGVKISDFQKKEYDHAGAYKSIVEKRKGIETCKQSITNYFDTCEKEGRSMTRGEKDSLNACVNCLKNIEARFAFLLINNAYADISKSREVAMNMQNVQVSGDNAHSQSL